MVEERLARRLAAILVADVVGYSRMMESDEAGTLGRLKTLRAEVFDPTTARYGGRIFKITGDGALVEFPSAFDAVKCGIAVQTALAERNAALPEAERVVLRIGISLGDVIVDGDDLYGNGVNVAARMEALAQPGEICVSGNVHEHIAHSMDIALQDLGEQAVKGIDRPVRSYRVLLDGAAPEARLEAPAALALPDKPSIAVLPFQNMSGDPEQEFFADGMAEDIITGLSRYRSLFVIARNSTFAYKGQSPDVRDVARDLGVKYVLEGSIRKAGARIRVTGQLIDGTTANHIWAERYDRELDDIFALQDEITETIVAAIGPEIDQVERERAQRLPPDSLDAWESYQRGLWHLYRFSREDNAEAQRLFRQSAARSANFAPAQSGLTHALYFSYMHGYPEDREAALDEAIQAARKAVAADDRDADAHFALGRILYLKRDYDASIAALDAAVGYNPNFAHAHLGLGAALLWSGELDRAVDSLERAERLSPHDPLLWIIYAARAFAALAARRPDEAALAARQAVRAPMATVTAYIALAASSGHLGAGDEAQAALAHALRLQPSLDIGYIAQVFPFRERAHIDYVVEGLRLAGLPV